jgi:hypothetical protein
MCPFVELSKSYPNLATCALIQRTESWIMLIMLIQLHVIENLLTDLKTGQNLQKKHRVFVIAALHCYIFQTWSKNSKSD